MSSSSASEENALNARKKDFSAFARLLRTFMRMEECAPFLERVDWEVLELWDYPDIVEVPMDLGTVKQKMGDSAGDGYKTVDEAADDVRQVWKNCLLYNAEGSDFYRLAQRLSAKFEDQFAEAYRDSSETKREVDPDAVATVPARCTLARNMLRLSNAERGRLMAFVERSYPSATQRCPMEGDVLINLDSFTQKGFRDVSDYVKKRIAATRKRGSAGMGAGAATGAAKKKR